MKLLLLGSGGREHALAWKISQSPKVEKLYIAPGNAGTRNVGENVAIQANDFDAIGRFVIDNGVHMVVVGPEDPLVKGIYDYFKCDPRLADVPVIGPSRAGAVLEGSKEFAKEFMERHHIPTARYRSFTADRLDEGLAFLETLPAPYVLKADGLCAGKGVLILPTLEEALLTAKGMVMLNLDKAFDYFDQVYGLLEKTGTTDLVIMKSGAPAAQVMKKYGKYLDKVVFMPIVDLDKHGAADSLRAYLSLLEPVAVELLYSNDANPLPRKAKAMTAGKARIWYNTLWSTQAGGHDDDCSLKDPDKGYGYLIDSLGATMLQTDRPQYLIDYLDKRKH